MTCMVRGARKKPGGLFYQSLYFGYLSFQATRVISAVYFTALDQVAYTREVFFLRNLKYSAVHRLVGMRTHRLYNQLAINAITTHRLCGHERNAIVKMASRKQPEGLRPGERPQPATVNKELRRNVAIVRPSKSRS